MQLCVRFGFIGLFLCTERPIEPRLEGESSVFVSYPQTAPIFRQPTMAIHARYVDTMWIGGAIASQVLGAVIPHWMSGTACAACQRLFDGVRVNSAQAAEDARCREFHDRQHRPPTAHGGNIAVTRACDRGTPSMAPSRSTKIGGDRPYHHHFRNGRIEQQILDRSQERRMRSRLLIASPSGCVEVAGSASRCCDLR
jgi:hypothetical protein